jgi:very-short-patch-repair endonuclease
MTRRTGFDAHGIATKRRLVAHGWSDAALTQAVAASDIVRLRNGWYATPEASSLDVSAIRAGGRVTGPSLARALGAWTADDTRLHVAVPSNASRLPRSSSSTVRHWTRPVEPPRRDSSRDTVPNAIAIVAQTLPLRDAVVTIDSALNLGLLTDWDWQRVLAHLSSGQRDIARHVDGRSQSGLETLCRLSLRAARVKLGIQVLIDGVGIVDVLVGDRLVIELDGRRFHDDPKAFENDRRRDLELARRGYRVLRLSYLQVMGQWESCEDVIVRLVRAGEHLWRPSSRKHYA